MKTTIPVIVTTDSVAAVIHGQPLTVASDNPCYREIKAALARGADADELLALFDKAQAIMKFTQGKVTVVNGMVYFGDQPVDNYVCQKILDFMTEGLPHEPLINFLEKLLKNPSRRSVEQLYRFLEHKQMPITPEGNFLAYKSVRSDYMDHHSGKFRNQPGDVNEVPRNQVDDDPTRGCSYGFHVGSLQYASTFGGSGSRMVICEVDPADVVAVPHDCGYQKLRTAKYQVIGEFEGPLPDHLARASAPYQADWAEDDYLGDEEEDEEDAPTYDKVDDIDVCPSCESSDLVTLRNDRRLCVDCREEFVLDRDGYAVAAP